MTRMQTMSARPTTGGMLSRPARPSHEPARVLYPSRPGRTRDAARPIARPIDGLPEQKSRRP